jgi:hypothetical protein
MNQTTDEQQVSEDDWAAAMGEQATAAPARHPAGADFRAVFRGGAKSPRRAAST